MRGAIESFYQERAEHAHFSGWRRDFFYKIVVAAEQRESAPARGFYFIQIVGDLCGGLKRLGKRPFKRIVPEICGQATERLFYCSGAAKEMLAARVNRRRCRDLSRFPVESLFRHEANQLMRALIEARVLIIQAVDYWSHRTTVSLIH